MEAILSMYFKVFSRKYIKRARLAAEVNSLTTEVPII